MIYGHGDDLFKYNNVEINFSTNIFNHFSHSRLFSFLASNLKTITSYPEPTPISLEKAIAERLGIESDCIMVTNGATEAIYLIAQSLSDKVAYIMQPTFAEYADACIMYGCETRSISTLEDIGSLGNEDAVWLCNPNNPTGSAMDYDLLYNIIRRNPQTVFIIDQSYSAYTMKRTLRADDAIELGNVLLINSMTKDFGIPGIRLGYAVGCKKILDRVKRWRMPWSVNALALKAGIYLIEHRDEYCIDAVALCTERERMAEQISLMGIKTFPSDSNMLLCELPSSSAAALKEWLASEQGMLIRDASNFHGLSERHFRIAVQTRDEDDKLIKALRIWTAL